MIELLAASMERILGWGSPIGLAIFFVGVGVLFYLTGWARVTKNGQKEK
jgi:hypothetical protein